MALRDLRNLAAMAYDGMGTFELGIVSEVFGLSRPELNVPWYEFRVFSLDRAPLRGTGGIRVQARMGWVCCEAPGPSSFPAGTWTKLRPMRCFADCARRTRRGRGWFRSALASSSSRPRGCSMASGPPRIGIMRNGWPRVIHAFRWKRTAYMWMRAAFSLRRAVRRGLTCVCTLCGGTMGRKLRTRWRDAW